MCERGRGGGGGGREREREFIWSCLRGRAVDTERANAPPIVA